MKKIIQLSLSLIILFLTTQLLAGVTLIDENFNSYTEGELPPNPPWVVTSSAGENPIYVTGSDTSKSLFIFHPKASSYRMLALTKHEEVEAKTFVFQYKIKTPSQAATNQWGSLVKVLCTTVDGTEIELIKTRWQGDNLIYFTNTDNIVKYEKIVSNAPSGDWHTFKAIIDVNTQTADLYWDSILIRDDIRISGDFKSSNINNINNFKLELGYWPQTNDAYYRHYYDKITLATVENITLLDEKFDDHSSNYPLDSPWTTEGGRSDQVALTSAASVSGPKCLGIVNPTTENSYGVQKRPINLHPDDNNPLLIIKYKIKTLVNAPTNQWASFVRLRCGSNEIFRTHWYGKSLRYSTTTNTNTQILSNDNESEWHDFKAVINRITRRVDIYWDNQMQLNDMPLYNWETPDSWDNLNLQIGFWPGGSENYTHYYDDLTIISAEYDNEINATGLIKENFDSYSNGAELGWATSGNNSGSDIIVKTSTTSPSYPNYLEINNPPNDCSELKYIDGLTSISDKLVLSYKVKTAQIGDNNWGSVVRIVCGGNEVFRVRWKGNDLYYSPTSGSVQHLLKNLDTSAWHTFKAVIDKEKHQIDIYWDGESRAVALPFLGQASPTSADWENVKLEIGFWEGGSNAYTHCYDDIKLTDGEDKPVNYYDYLPQHAHGDFKMTMHPRRFLELSWRNWNILSHAGEFFTPNYYSHWSYLSPVGWYLINDNMVGFDSPVQVETSKDDVKYTWICDAADHTSANDKEYYYRQINTATISDKLFVLRSTLEFSKFKLNSDQALNKVRFQPVFFPGKEQSYKSAEDDQSIYNVPCTLTDQNGSSIIRNHPNTPADPMVPWGGINWRSILVEHDNTPLHISFRSNVNGVIANLFPLARWPFTNTQGARRGLVSEFIFDLADYTAPFSITYEIRIEPVAEVADPETLSPATTTDLKLIPDLGDKAFWFFRPDEPINFSVKVGNEWSDESRSGKLLCEIRDYDNILIETISRDISIAGKTTSQYNINFGNLGAGVYSVKLQAIDSKGLSMGYTVFRLGVIPVYTATSNDAEDNKPNLGAFKYRPRNIDEKVELATWLGMGIMRFRAGNGEEEWHKFEPVRGQYTDITELTGVAEAQLFRDNNILLIHDGLPFPPVEKPNWFIEDNEPFEEIFERNEKTAFLPVNRTLFTDYVKAWIAKYKDNGNCLIDYFGVFNEPMVTATGANPAYPEKLGKVIWNMAKAIQEESGGKIATADINNLEINETDESKDAVKWLDSLLGSDSCDDKFDIITYHHYKTGWFKSDWYAQFPIIENHGWETDIKRVVELGDKYDKPVWNGEISWVGTKRELFAYPEFGADERNTTNTVIRSYLLTRAAGVSNIINCFATTISEPNLAYHIYPERAGSAVGWMRQIKPWAVAHATLSRLLDGATFHGYSLKGNWQMYLLTFQKGDNAFAVAWITHGSKEIDNPFSESEVDLLGVDGRILANTEKLLLTQEPIYLVGTGELAWGDFVAKIDASVLQYK